MTDFYIERQADRDFYGKLRNGDYCHVLSPPHTGKTRLVEKAKSRLKADGIHCAAIYLKTCLEDDRFRENDEETWYQGVIGDLAREFDLVGNDRYIDLQQDSLDLHESPKELLQYFIEDVVLQEVSGNIVIFVDEIEGLLSLNSFASDFPENFFSTIIGFYNKRRTHPQRSRFKRLTFALLSGVPALELIEDSNFPFDDGQRIKLDSFRRSDFQREEVQNLVESLLEKSENSSAVIDEILHWTSGQPLLTCELCKFILDPSCSYIYTNRERSRIRRLVDTKVIGSWEVQAHFEVIRDHLLQNDNQLLRLYRQVLQPEGLVFDRSPEQRRLKRLGLVVPRGNKLEVHNRIYKNKFNLDWVERILPPSTERNPPSSTEPSSQETQEAQEESDIITSPAMDVKPSTPSSTGPDEPSETPQQLTHDQPVSQRADSTRPDRSSRRSQSPERFAQFVESLPESLSNIAEACPVRPISIVLFVLAAILKVIPSKWRIKIGNILGKAWDHLRRRWKIVLILVITIAITLKVLPFFHQVDQIKAAGKEALKQSESTEIEALETALEAGNDLARKNLVNYIPLLRRILPASPLEALQNILYEIHEKNRLGGHTDLIKAVSFSPEGKWIATGGNDRTLRLWNASGKQIGNNVDTRGRISSLSFSSDGKLIATGGEDGLVKLWTSPELQSHPDQPSTKCPQRPVRSLSFSQDGNYLVTGGADGRACLWNMKELQEEPKKFIPLKNVSRGNVYSVSFKPGSQVIAIGGGDGYIELRDLNGRVSSQQLNQNLPFDISFSKDGTKVATAGKNGRVKLWHWQKDQNQEEDKLVEKKSWDVYKNLGPTPDRNAFLSVSFNPPNKLVAVVENKDILRVWDLPEQEEEKFIELNGYDSNPAQIKEVESASFDPSNQKLVTAAQEDQARLWDLLEKSPPPFRTDQGSIRSLSVRSDSNPKEESKEAAIVALGENGTVRLWSIGGVSIPADKLEKHDQVKVTSVSFIPKENQFATAGEDGKIRFWNLEGKPKSKVLDTNLGKITSISFSPVSQIAAIAGEDGTVQLRDCLTEDKIDEFDSDQGEVTLMSFSPNGQRLVTVGSEQTKLWDLSNKQAIAHLSILSDHPGGVSSVGFSADGRIATVAKEDSQIKFWNSSNGTPKDPPTNIQQEKVTSISFSRTEQNPLNLFSPDQSRLATAGADGTVKVWDWQWREVATFKSGLNTITSFSSSPDGKYVVAGGDDGRVQVWEVEDLEKLLEQGCGWLQDYHATHSSTPGAKACRNKLPQESGSPST